MLGLSGKISADLTSLSYILRSLPGKFFFNKLLGLSGNIKSCRILNMKNQAAIMEKARNNESGDNREDGNTSISSSSTMKENKTLPCDILLDIISRLPILCLPKDLIRSINNPIKSSDEHTRFHILATNNSKFVRHHWEKSLTTNPSVIALNPEKNRFYFAEDYTSYDTATEIDIGHESKPYNVSGICHGIVCLTNRTRTYSDMPLDVYLWNPVTREQLRIECPKSNLPRNWYCEVVVGFGCLQGATDYKVLQLCYQLYSDFCFGSYARVYSLRLNLWREVQNISDEIDKVYNSDEHAMVNDSLHWLVGVSQDLCDRILAFNMKDETFKMMRIPFSCKTSERFAVPSLHVIELGGQLCVYDNPIDRELQVWVMREYGVRQSWTTLFKIGGVFGEVRPLGVANNGEIILKKNIVSLQQLMLYNSETKKVKKFKSFTHQHYDQAYVFTPSLIALKEEDKDGQ